MIFEPHIRKILLCVYFLLNHFVSLGQNDDELNPAARNKHNSEKHNGAANTETTSTKYDQGTVAQLPKIMLSYYKVGVFRHPNMRQFCKKISSEIDLYEKKNDKIISILIIGYADGIKNKGIKYKCKNIDPECLSSKDSILIVDDLGLAKLRACQIATILKSYLRDKDYFINTKIKEQPVDAPDGTDIGGQYRKVEVYIKILNRQP